MTEHDGKAKIVWEAFMERLGKTEFRGMLFNLNSLMTTNEMLNELEVPFNRQEIDKVITELPNNKSTGPRWFQ